SRRRARSRRGHARHRPRHRPRSRARGRRRRARRRARLGRRHARHRPRHRARSRARRRRSGTRRRARPRPRHRRARSRHRHRYRRSRRRPRPRRRRRSRRRPPRRRRPPGRAPLSAQRPRGGVQSAIRRDVFGWAAGALIVAAVYALHAAGLLARLEAISDEARAKLLAREVASDIVIVAIDSHSLRELDEWPWPRRHYARLLQHLSRQPPRTLFLDIDFSSHASAQDDELFERALAEWPGAPVLLAAHAQPLTAAGGELAATEPLPRFAEHAALASVVLEPDADGFLRSMPAAWPIGGRDVP